MANTPDNIYAAPARRVASGAGAQLCPSERGGAGGGRPTAGPVAPRAWSQAALPLIAVAAARFPEVNCICGTNLRSRSWYFDMTGPSGSLEAK